MQFNIKLKTYFNLDILTCVCVCVCVCVCMCVCALSCSVMTDPVVPWTVACQSPLPMEFSTQEYWSGVPFPTPGDLS